MDKGISCIRCGHVMRHIKDDKLQLGQTGWILGDISNLISGALDVSIYTCKECGKIEFFQRHEDNIEDQIDQKQCPNCGKTHDIDYPKCPFCKYNYY